MTRSPLRACRALRDDHAEAQIVAYIDDYKLLMAATLAVIPLLIVLSRRPMGASRMKRLSGRSRDGGLSECARFTVGRARQHVRADHPGEEQPQAIVCR